MTGTHQQAARMTNNDEDEKWIAVRTKLRMEAEIIATHHETLLLVAQSAGKNKQ